MLICHSLKVFFNSWSLSHFFRLPFDLLMIFLRRKGNSWTPGTLCIFNQKMDPMFPKRNRHPYPKSPDDRSNKVTCKCIEFLIDSVDVTVYEDDLQLQRRIRWFWQLWVLKEEHSHIFWEDGLLRSSEKWKYCATDWPVITVRFGL